MASIYGFLGMPDRDTTLDSLNKDVFWTGIQQFLDMHNNMLTDMYGVFVEEETTKYTETYYLNAGGRMQRSTRQTRPHDVKQSGSYGVGYPLLDSRDGQGWDDITYAYMTVKQLDAQMKTVRQRAIGSSRYDILRALFNNTNEDWWDEKNGLSVTVRRLANADGTSFPPLLGTDTETTGHNHYVSSGYAASSISDTNNPFATGRDHLRHHFDKGKVYALINSTHRAKVEALSGFTPAPKINVEYGANANLAFQDLPAPPPGEFIGTVSDVQVFIWDWIPANYIYFGDQMQPAPTKRRVDEIARLRGLQLVAQEKIFPFEEAFWRLREGYGVGNRLNGFVIFLDTGGSYVIPTDYA